LPLPPSEILNYFSRKKSKEIFKSEQQEQLYNKYSKYTGLLELCSDTNQCRNPYNLADLFLTQAAVVQYPKNELSLV